MDCPHIPQLGYGEFSRRLHTRIIAQRIPIAGSLELTFRCNMRCVHCYVAHSPQGQELSFAEMCRILDQVTDEGCLWLLLTGGDPLMRPDALEIYLYAKRKGLIVTLFTNGTLITPAIADRLAEWRPFAIEITLYGRTQATFERITGIPGSHARCMRGIELLLERKLPLRLKTMLLTLNRHELKDMQAYATSLGVPFRFDPMVNAGLTGAREPLAFRLSPEEIVAFDMADEQRMKEWREFCARYRNVHLDDRYLYVCGAGQQAFHIDPYGNLSVCMLSRQPGYDLRQGSFRQGWREFLPQVRQQWPDPAYPCNRCQLLPLCGQCPGWGWLEHGKPDRPVDFLCQVAHQRAAALGASCW